GHQPGVKHGVRLRLRPPVGIGWQGERVRVADTARAGAEAPGRGPLLHHGFAAWAVRTPRATAVICGDRRLTYAELASRAAAVAGMLLARGVGPDTPVAVVMRRGWEQVAAALGTLRSGGAY